MTRRLVTAVVTVLALVLTGCSTSEPEGGRPDATTERAPFAPGPYDEGDVEADVAALAGWGIPTFEDAEAIEPMVEVTGPEVPLRLLREQVEVMGSEAAGGVGTTGAALDEAFAIGAGGELRISTMLAAWLQSGSDMATGLRGTLATVDLEHPDEAVFPTVVLTGFIRDLALSPGGSEATATMSASPAVFTRAAAIDPCSASSTWVEDMLGKLFDGLKIKPVDTSLWNDALVPLGWLLNLFISAYDAIRQGAKWIVIRGYQVLVAPIREALAQISLLMAVVQTALTTIHPLTSSWDGPNDPEYGVLGSEKLTFDTTVHVRSTNPLVWPPTLRRCAEAAGLTLPNPTLEDSEVSWTVRAADPAAVTEVSSDKRLKAEGEGGKATFTFSTAQEPRDWKERGDVNLIAAILTAHVLRKNKQIRDAVNYAVGASLRRLLGFLPPFMRQYAEGAIRQAIDPLLDNLVVTSKYDTARKFYVRSHMKPEDTPTPTPTMPTPSPPPPKPQPVWVYVDRPGIPGSVEPGRILQFVACDGLAGTWRGKLRTGGLYDDDGFTVPWADLPARPFRIANGGIGSTTSRASGVTQVLGESVPVTFDLRISVNGRSMSVDGVPVQAPVSFRSIPIRNTPKGMCP